MLLGRRGQRAQTRPTQRDLCDRPCGRAMEGRAPWQQHPQTQELARLREGGGGWGQRRQREGEGGGERKDRSREGDRGEDWTAGEATVAGDALTWVLPRTLRDAHTGSALLQDSVSPSVK